MVVVRFGEQYRQWNAAFDAGQAAALGKALITLHPPQHDHALKEVDRAALAVAREPEQVVEILRYVLEETLPSGWYGRVFVKGAGFFGARGRWWWAVVVGVRVAAGATRALQADMRGLATS